MVDRIINYENRIKNTKKINIQNLLILLNSYEKLFEK